MNLVWPLFRLFKTEIKIVLASLAVLIALPVVSLAVFASAGSDIVGKALANPVPGGQAVELLDPDGNVVAQQEKSSVWPVRGIVTDEFGVPRKHGIHHGIDIANEYGLSGDPVTVFRTGRVTKVDDRGWGDCGQFVRVNHGDNVTSMYCHLSAIFAAEGDEVEPGKIIGLEGSTGESSGPHLHFQISVYDVPVNPRNFMIGEPERNLPNGGVY